MTSKILLQLGDIYEVNTSSKETNALFVIVLDYGTVKSFAIRVRGVKFLKSHQTPPFWLISEFSNFRNFCPVIVTSTMMTSALLCYIYPVQIGQAKRLGTQAKCVPRRNVFRLGKMRFQYFLLLMVDYKFQESVDCISSRS